MRIYTNDSDEESSEDTDHISYDVNCNTTMNRRGHLTLCKHGMTTRSLEQSGWVRLRTEGGRNGYIFKRPRWVLKIVKHHTARNDYCSLIQEAMSRIRILCDIMGPLSPRIQYMRVCRYNNEPALSLLMRDEGPTNVPLPEVTEKQITSTVRRLVRFGIISLDVVMESATVNTGNMVFRLSPRGRCLTVRFLDVDVPENFMDTTAAPSDFMERLWYKIVRVCLRRPTEAITYEEVDELSSVWSPLLT
jgi:hypothetical protein